MSDLFETIKATLAAENPSSLKVREVIQGVRTKISELEKVAVAANERMLDPRTDGEAVKALRFDKADASFLVDRLTAGLPMLEKALADAEYREDQERRLEVYEAASRRMDDVRAALETRYPQLAGEIALLFRTSLETLLEVQEVNSKLPDGKPPVAIPAALNWQGKSEFIFERGNPPLVACVSLPGHWNNKSESVFEGGASPTSLLSLNR